MHRLLRTLGLMFLLALLPVGYLLSGPYLDRRAIREANDFCSLVSEGEAVSSLRVKARRKSVLLEEWSSLRGVGERYIARFSGFLANEVYCEISIVDQRVTSRFVEEAFW